MRHHPKIFVIGLISLWAVPGLANEADFSLAAAKKALKRACADIDLHHSAEDGVAYIPEEGEESVDLNPSLIQPPKEIRIPLRLNLGALLPDVGFAIKKKPDADEVKKPDADEKDPPKPEIALEIAGAPQTGELGTLIVSRDGKEMKYNGYLLKGLPSKGLKELCGKVGDLW